MARPATSVPFWLTVGFALGVVFGWLTFRPERPATPDPAPQAGPPPEPKASLPFIPTLPADTEGLQRVEELFQAWGGYAVWDKGLTQFALWSRESGQHDTFYEVRRSNRRFYFRTLPQADWPLIDHGMQARCALWFAEPAERRERYYRENPEERPGLVRWVNAPERPPPLPPNPSEPIEQPAPAPDQRRTAPGDP
jgi:hypothetical protein